MQIGDLSNMSAFQRIFPSGLWCSEEFMIVSAVIFMPWWHALFGLDMDLGKDSLSICEHVFIFSSEYDRPCGTVVPMQTAIGDLAHFYRTSEVFEWRERREMCWESTLLITGTTESLSVFIITLFVCLLRLVPCVVYISAPSPPNDTAALKQAIKTVNCF